MKEQYETLISKIDILANEYLKTKDENLLSIIKYELYKIIKLHIKEIGLQNNEYAYSTGLIIINNVVNNWIINYDNLKEKSLAKSLISTLNKMPLRKKVYQLEDSKEDDLLIQRYSYIVDKTLNKLEPLNYELCRKLMMEKFEEIPIRLKGKNNLKSIVKISETQMFQFGISKRKEINKLYNKYYEYGKVILSKFINLYDDNVKIEINKYYNELVKKYFSLGYFFDEIDFEKYLFNELIKFNSYINSNIDGISKTYRK